MWETLRRFGFAAVVVGAVAVAAGGDVKAGATPATRRTQPSLARSQKVFAARCAKCHGAAGMSDTPDARALKVAPLADHPRLKSLAPADIALAVKGNAKHRGIVHLDDRDIDAAAAFVKHLAGHE